MAKTFVESEQSGRVDVLEGLLFETCGAALEVARIANCAGFYRGRGAGWQDIPGPVTKRVTSCWVRRARESVRAITTHRDTSVNLDRGAVSGAKGMEGRSASMRL